MAQIRTTRRSAQRQPSRRPARAEPTLTFAIPDRSSPWRLAMSSVMIRVTPNDFDSWRAAHESCRRLRRNFAVTQERIYQGLDEQGTALVELETTDVARTMAWFTSAQIAKRSHKVTLGSIAQRLDRCPSCRRRVKTDPVSPPEY